MSVRKLLAVLLFFACSLPLSAENRSGSVDIGMLSGCWFTAKERLLQSPDSVDAETIGLLVRLINLLDRFRAQPLFSFVMASDPGIEKELSDAQGHILRLADNLALSQAGKADVSAYIGAIDSHMVRILKGYYDFAIQVNRKYMNVIYFFIMISFLVIFLVLFNRRAISSVERNEAYATAYAHSVITAHEDERKMLSRELHDTIVQDITVMKLKTEALFYMITKSTKKYDESFEALILNEQACIEKIRSMCYQLRPPELDYLDLKAALSELCSNFQENTGIHCLFDCTGEFSLAAEKEANVFRIVQESLANVRKHSGASSVHVLLNCPENRKLAIEIRDNGIGFDTDTLKQERKNQPMNFGLKGIKERVEILGGRLEVESAEGSGTGITVIIPLTAD